VASSTAVMASYPEGPLPAIITTVTNDAANSGASGQSGAPAGGADAGDVDPAASPKRLAGGLLRAPSSSNGLGELTGGSEVSRHSVPPYVRFTHGRTLKMSPLTWGRQQIRLSKRCAFRFIEYRTKDRVQKPSSS
jgi:hypothetical protein